MKIRHYGIWKWKFGWTAKSAKVSKRGVVFFYLVEPSGKLKLRRGEQKAAKFSPWLLMNSSDSEGRGLGKRNRSRGDVTTCNACTAAWTNSPTDKYTPPRWTKQPAGFPVCWCFVCSSYLCISVHEIHNDVQTSRAGTIYIHSLNTWNKP